MRKDREVWSLRLHQMGRGRDHQLSFGKALGSGCQRGAQEQTKEYDSQSRRQKGSILIRKGQKIPDSSEANGGRPGSQVQGEQFTAITRNTAGLEDHVEMVKEESRSTAVLRENIFRKSQI